MKQENSENEHRHSPLAAWVIAVRPWAYSASILPVFLGTATAWNQRDQIQWLWFAVTLAAVVSFHTAGNLINDGYDFMRGLDTEKLPGSGAVVRGLLSPEQALRAAVFFILFGVLCAAYLAAARGLFVLLLGIAGVFFAVAYTAPGVNLKCRGFGDLCIFFAFGPLPTIGSHWVQTGRFAWKSALVSVPAALFTVAILHANNWRDMENDARKGCQTLAVLLGPKRAGYYYRSLVVLPYAIVAACGVSALTFSAVPGSYTWLFLPWLSFPAIIPLLRIRASGMIRGDTAVPAALDARTATVHSLFGLLLVTATILSG